jgi:predicted small metal-binding protein
MKSAICSGLKKSMEIFFNVQPTLHSKNKIVPDLSEHDCTSHNLDSVVDFTNIIGNITTREVKIIGALKFENCKFENCNFNVTAGKEKEINEFRYDFFL